MKRLTLLIILIALPLGAAQAQKRAFTIEDLYRIKSIGDVHLSPDGKTIVYTVSTPDLARSRRTTQIWLVDADGRNARQITQGDKSSNSPVFSPDGRDDLRHTARRVGLDEDMNVIRHHFEGVDAHAQFGRDFRQQNLQPIIHRRRQHGSAIFRAPHKVIPQREDRAGVLGVSIVNHEDEYMRGRYLFQLCATLTPDPAFRCRLKATVPSRGI